MYIKNSIGKFPTQNSLKQGDALTSLLFKFSLEYATGNVRKTQLGLKLNGTHRLVVYADEVNILCDNRDFVKKKTKTLKGRWSRNKHRGNLVYVASLPPDCRAKALHKDS
jgi:hypothetical protein